MYARLAVGCQGSSNETRELGRSLLLVIPPPYSLLKFEFLDNIYFSPALSPESLRDGAQGSSTDKLWSVQFFSCT